MGFTPDINTIDWDLSEHTYWYEYEFDGGAHDTYMEQSFVNGFVIQTFICNDELIDDISYPVFHGPSPR
jgi:hypothetical protein